MEFLAALTYRHFEEMARLEQQFYGDEHIAPPEQAYSWYQKYSYTCVAASEKGRIAGFVNLFPIRPEILLQLRKGSFNDRDLTSDCIVDIHASETEPLFMFLSCIVVDRAYHGKGLARRLLQKAVESYAEVSHRCSCIVTDNVTEEGIRFSARYGFRPLGETEHASLLQEQDYQSFCRRLEDGASAKDLQEQNPMFL